MSSTRRGSYQEERDRCSTDVLVDDGVNTAMMLANGPEAEYDNPVRAVAKAAKLVMEERELHDEEVAISKGKLEQLLLKQLRHSPLNN